jgi:hypothetical protein
MKYTLSFTLNRHPVDVLVKPTDTLLDVLREKLYVMRLWGMYGPA